MFTYKGLQDTSYWAPFLDFVAEHLADWRVKNWSATMEANYEQGVHIHLWGRISGGGFHHVVYHADRKLDEDEWSDVVRKGKLVAAVKALRPVNTRGPWWVIVDNESFLRTASSKPAYKDQKIKLWGIPAKSPDLNPVEKFWAWLRKQLRAQDFADLRARRKVPGKTAYTLRIKRILRSASAQRVAGNIAL